MTRSFTRLAMLAAAGLAVSGCTFPYLEEEEEAPTAQAAPAAQQQPTALERHQARFPGFGGDEDEGWN